MVAAYSWSGTTAGTPGTENPPLVHAIAVALADAIEHRDERVQLVRERRSFFLQTLMRLNVPFTCLSPDDGVPHVLALAFPGLQGEALVTALAAAGVMISSGSACSAHRSGGNPVLLAMGYPDALVRNSVRLSIAHQTTEQELLRAAEVLADVLGRYAIY